MKPNEFEGQGGSYLIDETGKHTCVEEPTVGATRSRHPDAQQKAPAIGLQQTLAGTAAEVISVLPHLSPAQLAELATLESAGKSRKTVLDALAAIPAVAQP